MNTPTTTTKTKHAVITENYICWKDGDQSMWHMCPIWNAAHALEVAQVWHFTHMWVLPGSYCDRVGWKFFEDASAGNPDVSYFPERDADTPSPKFERVNTGPRTPTVMIGYPRAFGWEIVTANDLLDTIALIEGQFDVPCQWGPAHIGRQVMRQTWAKKPRVLRDTAEDTRDLPYNGNVYDLLFMHPLTESMIGQYVHHYDKNSAYLAACRSTKMGIGDPLHVEHQEGYPIVPGLPGIYRITWRKSDDSSFDGVYLPTVIDPRQEWITNDLLLYARQQGYEVFIHEAFVWEDYQKILDPVAWTIWTARQLFKSDLQVTPDSVPTRNAYNTMKGIALAFVGAFNMQKEKHSTSRDIHSNWWGDVVSKARVSELANIAKYLPVAGAPLVIEADALYYVSRDANPRTAVPGILDRQSELGGYKHCGSCKITREMYELAIGLSESKVADMFKVAGGEK